MTGANDVEGALKILGGWCRCVVIKLGADGCRAVCEGRSYRVAALPVEAIDTTGAGDNFNAGMIYGLLNGYSLEESLRCGTVAGALSTLVLGGCGGTVGPDDLQNWLGRLSA
jgi:sugar/nucleoside kinase (ribokinase family)